MESGQLANSCPTGQLLSNYPTHASMLTDDDDGAVSGDDGGDSGDSGGGVDGDMSQI